jgi:hypothetical protein
MADRHTVMKVARVLVVSTVVSVAVVSAVMTNQLSARAALAMQTSTTTPIATPAKQPVMKLTRNGGICPDGTLTSYIADNDSAGALLETTPSLDQLPCPETSAILFSDGTWVRSVRGVDIADGTIPASDQANLVLAAKRMSDAPQAEIDAAQTCNLPCGNGTEYLRWDTMVAFVRGAPVELPPFCDSDGNQFAEDRYLAYLLLTTASNLQ